MLPGLFAVLYSSQKCMVCAPKSLPLFLRTIRYATSLRDSSGSVSRSKQFFNDSVKRVMPCVEICNNNDINERKTSQPCYAHRYHLPSSKRSSYYMKKLSRLNRSSLQRYSLLQRHSNTEWQCRNYTTRSVNETLTEWADKLEAASVPEAKLSTEHIIAHILGVPRKDLNVLQESHLSEDVACEVERLMTCRLARMPVQYIIGNWDFHSVTIKMRPPVFIPRPETEQLVELALECLQHIHRPRVLDIGCGSGAISLALLKNISDLRCVALDHSRHAIELTDENASLLGVRHRLTLLQEKVMLNEKPNLPCDEFDLIVSNPPYVLRKDLMEVQPEIMIYEDMRALDGGKEGLDVVKPILLHCQHYLPPGRHLLLEVDPCHQYLIPTWMDKQTEMKLDLLEVLKDFQGKERFLKFVKVT